MKNILTTFVCVIAVIITSSFTTTWRNEINKLTGQWKLIEIKEITFNANRTHHIKSTTFADGTRKEYNKDSSFKTFTPNQQTILEGKWELVENKIVENFTVANKNANQGGFGILGYMLQKNKLTLEYAGNSKNVIVHEIWKKVK